MTISVVITAYNEEKFIDDCLHRLLKQTQKPDEIIVVDNNSTDKTASIVKTYKGIILINEKVQGITPARNAGFRHAKSDIIARIDADTVISNNWVETIKENFESKKCDALTGPIYFNDLPKNAYYTFLAFIFCHASRAWLLLLLHNSTTLLGPNMAITKQAWNQVSKDLCKDDSKLHEDFDMSIHLLNKGGKIKYVHALRVGSSGRRIKLNPKSYYLEYPFKTINTLTHHL